MIVIKTKWGKLQMDANAINEINVQIKPWDNLYKLEFVMEGTYNRQYAEVDSLSALSTLIHKLTNELTFVKQYRYKDGLTGRMQVNEPRRLQALANRKPDEENV